MRDFLMGLVAGLILAASTGWYWFVGRKTEPVQHAQDQMAGTLQQTADKLNAKIEAFELRGTDIKEDLSRTGEVLRNSVRAFGASVADSTADTRITAGIKTKLLADSELSAWNIAVNTTDGLVTLSGKVATHEQIGRAVLLALEVKGVRAVRSTLQVKN